MIGRFIPTDELYFGARIGSVTIDGIDYQMHVMSRDNTPIFMNVETGKKFHLRWEDIADLALKAGISGEPVTQEQSDESDGECQVPEEEGRYPEECGGCGRMEDHCICKLDAY